mgnify:CR=1 FL=1
MHSIEGTEAISEGTASLEIIAVMSNSAAEGIVGVREEPG